MSEGFLVTAADLARGAGRDERGVRLLLKLTPAQTFTMPSGQEVKRWSLAALPPILRAELEAARKAAGCRDIPELLGAGWRPKVPLAKQRHQAVTAAHKWKDWLAPLLTRQPDAETAELIRLALAAKPGCGESERTIRRKIDQVRKRDGGRCDWQEPSLYTTKRARHACAADRREPKLWGVLEHALQSVKNLLGPTRKELEFIWDAACRETKRATEKKNYDFTAARAAVVSVMQDSGVRMVQGRTFCPDVRPVLLNTLTRKWAQWQAGGPTALADRRIKSEGHASPCGRKPRAVLNEQEERLAKQYLVKMDGSKTSALRALANSPECRPEVADVINKKRASKHTLTRALRDQIHVPQQVIDYHKSPKQVRVNGFINPRTLTYLSGKGTEEKIQPGDVFERDDMSNNFLCWVPWPQGGDPCSDRFGVRVARGQNLIMCDVGSLYFASFNFLIRLRDSYRADDIWGWVGQTYRDIGLPRIGERWERGTWESKRLRGDKSATMEAGHTDEPARLGGMEALGLRVITSHSPTTKIIENRFSFFQRRCALIPTLQIGRKAGEMERETKLWMRMRAGYLDPREYCLSHEQCADELEKAMHYVNSEPVEGSIYRGIPEHLWSEGIAANPLALLAPEQGWLFSRDKREITARKGHLRVRYTTPDGYRAEWYFHHPELYQCEGVKVSAYFDHYAPAEGATLVIAEGRKAGAVIGHAELVQGCPQFALSYQTGDDSAAADRMLGALDRKKEFLDAVSSQYRALGIGGRRIAKASRVDDGAGRVVSVSNAPELHSRPAPAAKVGSNLAARAHALKMGAQDREVEEQLIRVRKLEAEAVARGEITLAE